jgi:Ser/Thr protein kinase RdoA (MazF antagonist)
MDAGRDRDLVLKSALQGTGLENGQIQRINEGFQNEIYSWKNGGQEFILRVQTGKGRTRESISAELEWIRFLSEHGVKVARPILIGNEEVKRVGEHRFFTIFEKAKGRPVEVMNPDEWSAPFFYSWGKAIGRMHTLAAAFHLQAGSERPVWRRESPNLFRLMDRLEEPVREIYLTLINSLSEFTLRPDTFGLIHNDLHQGNFFVDGHEITFFDFDDCSFNWFANDLAVSYYHAHWQGTSFNPEDKEFPKRFLSCLLKGYQSEKELHPDTVKQIPIFLKIREIFLYQLFKEKWDHNHLEDWQEYTLQDLKLRIEGRVPFDI